MRIGDLLLRNDGLSTVIKQGNIALTYHEWLKYSSQLSQLLISVMHKDSMTVALYLPNSIEYCIAYFGILFANKVVVPIGTHAKAPELLSTLIYCEVDCIILNEDYKEFVCNCIEQYPQKILLYVIDKDEIIHLNTNKVYGKKSNQLIAKDSEDDVAIMLHTSGTISNPKRVMLSHKNILCNVESNIESLQLTNKDNVLIALPMFFGYCNTSQLLTHIYLGSNIVIFDEIFMPKRFFQLVEREKISTFTGVPSMLLMLMKYRYFQNYDFKSLRYICFGGGKMPIEKLKELIKIFPSVGFVQTYGQTECSPRVTALLPEDSLRKVGSVGRPLPRIEVQIFDKYDKAVSYNAVGEIVVQGDNIMKGYYKQPELTDEILRNGWLHTGDLGYFDEEGYLYLTGRIKNVIISGGINIYPEEIEQILIQHDSIKEAYVFGEEDEILGEVPIAKIVLNSKITTLEIKRYCEERLSSYKIPVRFDVVEGLLKTYNGKIKRI